MNFFSNLLAPVVVTSQTYQQPSGGQVPYPISLTTTTNANMNQMNYQPPMQPPISHQNIPMAMPMPNSNLHYTHYPPASSSSAPYPLASSTAPYPTNTTAPYPPSTYSTPYPTKNPYNDQSSQVHPPTYSQAVDSGTFEQQPAFNPTYKH